MKNLLKSIGIEKLDEVPIDLLDHRLRSAESYKKNSRSYGYRHRHNEDSIVKKKTISTYKLADFIAKKYLGKQYDKAFSEFCSQVDQHQYEIFKQNFDEHIKRRWFHSEGEYIIDKQGRIQKNKNYRSWKRQKPIEIKSDDFEITIVHKDTGHPKSEFTPVYEKVPYTYNVNRWRRGVPSLMITDFKNGKLLYYEYGTTGKLKPINMRYRAQEEDFHAVVTKGWIKYFKSKQDPEFIRLKEDKRKRHEAEKRQKKVKDLEKAYSFISQTELKLKQEQELNKLNIERHGFDPITSFRAGKSD